LVVNTEVTTKISVGWSWKLKMVVPAEEIGRRLVAEREGVLWVCSCPNSVETRNRLVGPPGVLLQNL
jgi:hypothetical protein